LIALNHSWQDVGIDQPFQERQAKSRKQPHAQ